MRDPNDYIVIGVWGVALVCVLIIIGSFQATGQATATYTSIDSGLEWLSGEVNIIEGEGPVKCNHPNFCDGTAILQIIDGKMQPPKQTFRGNYMCVCKS